MNRPWRIELLGRLCVVGGQEREGADRTITRFRTRKTAALLAFLAYHSHRAHAREELIDGYWPEQTPDAGRDSLRTALASLRRQLEPPGIPPGSVLTADRASVRLNPEAVVTDVAEFEAGLHAADRAEGAARSERLAETLEIYGGGLLPDFFDDWVLRERERLAEAFGRAASELIASLEAGGDLQGALRHARRAAVADPLREEAHRDLIRLLAATEQIEAARRQYHELERVLDQELGAAPAEETRVLLASLGEGAKDPTGRGGDGATGRESRNPSSRGRSIPFAPSPPRPLAPSPAPPILPAMTLTLLMTDMEGSTATWERLGDTFRDVLTDHHALLRSLFREHRGIEVKEMGDSFLAAFPQAEDAVRCAVLAQQALAAHPWPAQVGAPRVRMALHTGEVELRSGDYRGLVLNHLQRILEAGHGGQILCSQTTRRLVESPSDTGVSWLDLGVHRLRDVAAPQRLYQVDAPTLPRREFPPLAVPPSCEDNLPMQFTPFFGREREIAALCELLIPGPPANLRCPSGAENRSARLVTLTGPGGTGKTRLALEVASRLAAVATGASEDFGAVWFVPLADLSPTRHGGAATRQSIAARIRDTLRLSRSADREPLDQVVEALGRQPSLLVLDNFEQIATEGAALVHALLVRVPSLLCLVTSRRCLDLPAEREFPVAPLPVPAAPAALGSGLWALGEGSPSPAPRAQSPERLLALPSIQLFVDRAQRARPDFQLTAGNAAAVAALCERLEGIPLAIELIAARSRALAPARMLSLLEQRLDLAERRADARPARHQSLRAAQAWSFALLAPSLQRFFAALSVFRGGWSDELAAEVCDEPAAPDYLAQLRAASLVETYEIEGELRFRMLETLREYASEQLDPAERGVRERRHLECCIALAEKGEPELQGPDQAEWLERLEREHDNFRIALARATEEHDPALPPLGLRLAGALSRFWMLHGHAIEGLRQLETLLEIGPGSEPSPERGKAHSGAGIMAHMQGNYAAAQRHYEESLSIRRAIGDRQGVASCLNNLGSVAERLGDYDAARALQEEGLALRRELGDRVGISYSLNNLGTVTYLQGDYATSRAYHEESLQLKRELGEQWGIAASLENLGSLTYDLGEFAAAKQFYEESLAIRRTLGDRSGIANAIDLLGSIAHTLGDLPTARALHEEAHTLQRAVGDRRGIAFCLNHLGNLSRDEENPTAAHALFEEALVIGREIGDRECIAASLSGLATLCCDDPARARTLNEEALALRREMGTRFGVAASLHELGILSAAEGNLPSAARYLRESLTLQHTIGDRHGVASSLTAAADLALQRGRTEPATRLQNAARTLRASLGLPEAPSAPLPANDAIVPGAGSREPGADLDAAVTLALAELDAMWMSPCDRK